MFIFVKVQQSSPSQLGQELTLFSKYHKNKQKEPPPTAKNTIRKCTTDLKYGTQTTDKQPTKKDQVTTFMVPIFDTVHATYVLVTNKCQWL